MFQPELDSGDDNEHLRDAGSGAPLARREGMWLFTELPDQEFDPRMGCYTRSVDAATRISRKLVRFLIP